MLTSVAGATVWSIGNSDAKRALDPRTDWDAIFKKRRRNGYILMGAGTAAAILTVVISAVSLADWGSSWWDDKPDPNRQLRWDLATAGATLSGVTSVVCYAVGSALLAPTQRDLALKVEAAPGGVALRF